MTTVIFVHGTGVRFSEKYEETFAVIQEKLGVKYEVKPCNWGSLAVGIVRPVDGFKSIPDERYSKTTSEHKENPEKAKWFHLSHYPYIELDELIRSDDNKYSDPSVEKQKKILLGKLEALSSSFEEEVILQKNSHPFSSLPHDSINKFKEIQEQEREVFFSLINQIRHPKILAEFRVAVARSIIVQLLDYKWCCQNLLAGQSAGTSPGTPKNDPLTSMIVYALGGQSLGMRSTAAMWGVKKADNFFNLLSVLGSFLHFSKSAPTLQDILMYQARGIIIRDEIKRCILGIDDDVILLCHSLGGIASFELLIEHENDKDLYRKVKGLITVGSQSSYLYEINALSTLSSADDLPSNFPFWLNIYDRADLLSFKIEGVIKGSNDKKHKDIEIQSRKDSLEAHGHYFSRKSLMWGEVNKWIEMILKE
jgi:hypothetical protein